MWMATASITKSAAFITDGIVPIPGGLQLRRHPRLGFASPWANTRRNRFEKAKQDGGRSMTHRCRISGSVDLDGVCLKCGGEGFGDYDCHSGEEAWQCSACGRGYVWEMLNRE